MVKWLSMIAVVLGLVMYHPTPAASDAHRCVEYDGRTFCDGMRLHFVRDYEECRNKRGIESAHTYKAETARDFHMLMIGELTAREFLMLYSERMRSHPIYEDSLVMIVLASCGFYIIS